LPPLSESRRCWLRFPAPSFHRIGHLWPPRLRWIGPSSGRTQNVVRLTLDGLNVLNSLRVLNHLRRLPPLRRLPALLSLHRLRRRSL
jgi:hypothetical protein